MAPRARQRWWAALAAGVFLLAGLPDTSQADARRMPDRPAGGRSATLQQPAFVSVHDFARAMGLEETWLEPRKKLSLKSGSVQIVLEDDHREADINGVRVFLGDAPKFENKTLMISSVDRDRLLLPVLAPQKIAARGPVKVIALDPGHGGRDDGTRNDALRLQEKDLTLDVVKRLKPLLEAAGYRVVLTRTDDSYIALPDRPARANAAGADLFVAVHFNAAGKDVRGLETYVLTPQFQRSTGSDDHRADDDVAVRGNATDAWNAFLGYTMHRHLTRTLGLPDRGLKRARFAVLRDLNCPGLLIEGGYLSHVAEAKLLGEPGFRQKLAQTIASGIDVYNQTLVRLENARHPPAARAPRSTATSTPGKPSVR